MLSKARSKEHGRESNVVEKKGMTGTKTMTRDNMPTTASTTTARTTKQITKDELRAHDSRDSAWISIKGRVYDVTEFTKVHPGGDIILTTAGGDATEVFAGFHAGTDSWRLLPGLFVGVLEGGGDGNGGRYDGGLEYVKDVGEMRKELVKLRLFESRKGFYLGKVLSNVCLLSVALWLVSVGGWGAVVSGAILLALFWQQCGWLAHDFLHHQVFEYRMLNDGMGVLVGNIWQGFSTSWWKNKHNHHHAVPNVTDSLAGGDPDILTMPLLYWSEKLIEGDDLKNLPRVLLRYQHVLYWPILCMARTSWLIQSILYQFEKRNKNVTSDLLYVFEILGLFIHHASFFYVLSWIPSVAQKIVFATLSQGLGGLFIGVVFTVGHNAMDVLTREEMISQDFIRLQLRTTRNVTPSLFNDWFTGGLNYQVEHHIWPTLPRHSLPTASRILKAFCKKHNIGYHCQGLIEGNAQVCRLLARLSATA